MRFAARLKSLDEAHPLAKRTVRPKPPVIHRSIKLKYQVPREGFRTRLRRSDQLLPCSRRPILLLAASATIRRCLCKPPRKTSQQRISAFGSAVGYGYAIHLDGQTVLSGCGRLGPAEVLMQKRKARSRACALPKPPRSQRVVVCLDNIAAATCLRGMPADSSQDVFLEFQALATAHGATEVRWIPGHTSIPGNEQADALAKAGTSQPEPAGAVPTLAYLRRAARQQPKVQLKPGGKPLHPNSTSHCTLSRRPAAPELKLPDRYSTTCLQPEPVTGTLPTTTRGSTTTMRD
ncbi:RNase H domain-containing protein [Hirsutella rhossiliensis]